jgi:transposase
MNKVSTLAANGGPEYVVAVIGIDLAKNLFARHGINAAGKTILVRPGCDTNFAAAPLERRVRAQR